MYKAANWFLIVAQIWDIHTAIFTPTKIIFGKKITQ